MNEEEFPDDEFMYPGAVEVNVEDSRLKAPDAGSTISVLDEHHLQGGRYEAYVIDVTQDNHPALGLSPFTLHLRFSDEALAALGFEHSNDDGVTPMVEGRYEVRPHSDGAEALVLLDSSDWAG